MRFSVIIPVYNRPEEVEELLESLARQTYSSFEIILVDDGSERDCREVAERYSGRLTVRYFWKENGGPGQARNFGAGKSGDEYDYLLFFDSDCVIPAGYMETVNRRLERSPVDVFGGPDRAGSSFTVVQKAISYSMTSFLTTGGIRGGRVRMDRFYPRSFNMGISKTAFREAGGFSGLRFGEDIEFSLRLEKMGYSLAYLEDVWVYHKRRTTLKSFFKQVFNSGMARYNLSVLHPGSTKFVHLLPTLFVVYAVLTLLLTFTFPYLWYPLLPAVLLFFLDALRTSRNPAVALLAPVTSLIQVSAYGMGYLWARFKTGIGGKQNPTAFDESFYK